MIHEPINVHQMSPRWLNILWLSLLLVAFGSVEGIGDDGSLTCGDWQSEYSRLHASIVSGQAPARYVVSVAVEAGFADNVVGIITEFFYALLTNRAFQITSHHPLPDFSAAFDSPNINWTRHVIDPESVVMPVRHTHKGERKHGPEVDPKKYAGVYMVNNNDINEVFSTHNLRSWPEGGDAENVFLCSNRGRVVKLFENPHHSQELYSMGLRPDTIFACGYKYLFEPNETVKKLFRPYMADIQSSTSALKIGVNIRAGDGVFQGSVVSESFGDAYIDCALQIEASRKKTNQSVIWCASRMTAHFSTQRLHL